MEIWKLEFENNDYQSYQLKNLEKTFFKEFVYAITSGQKQKGIWDNIDVQVIKGKNKSDIAIFWAGIQMMINEKTKLCLENIIKDSVEFIPINITDETHYLVNVVCTLDAIDYDNIVFKKTDTGLIVGFEKYSFLENKIRDVNIFRVMLNDHIHSTVTFVSSDFKAKVEENNLVGLKFEKVWESNS